MPAITTTTATTTENIDFFQTILNTLFNEKSFGKYEDSTLVNFINVLTIPLNFKSISESDLAKLIEIHTKFLSHYCTVNTIASRSNQTTPDSYTYFLKFSKAVQNKEDFFQLSFTNPQTRLKTDCETSLYNDTQRPIGLTTKLSAAAGHGVLAGSANAIMAIALESAKSKKYTETQLNLLKTGLLFFNSLAIASYASISVYLENAHESEAAPVAKMAQSFAWSLASTTSLYALTHGINYFTKPLKNKLIKGFLNALPLAGNMGLLIQSGNNLAETAAMMGVNFSSGSLVSAALQTGSHFFSKRRNHMQNTDQALEFPVNEVLNTTPAIAETSFSTDENSNNTRTSHLYEWVKDKDTRVEEGGYLCMNKGPQLDDSGYLQADPTTPVASSVAHTQPTSTFSNHGYSYPKPPIPVTSSVTHTQPSFFLDKMGYSYPKPPISVTNSTAPIPHPEIIAKDICVSKKNFNEKHHLSPNTLTVNPMTHSAPKPALPPRNLRFLSSGGLCVISTNNEESNVSQSSADRTNTLS